MGISDLTRVPHSGKIEPELEHFFDEYFTPAATLPVMWALQGEDGIGGPAVTDPLLLHIEMPIGEDVDAPPTWSVSFRDVLADLIDGLSSPNSGFVYTVASVDLLIQIRAALAEEIVRLSQIIDAAPADMPLNEEADDGDQT